MNFTSVSSPVWANQEQTEINCNVTTDYFGDEILPFTASPNDCEVYGQQLFTNLVGGIYGPIAAFIPTPPPVITAEQNKSIAVAKLKATDWVNEPDVYENTYDPHLLNREEYLQYRSAIRAIAINPVAGNITWPQESTPKWSIPNN